MTALEQTFNEIVRRHEALRTKFEMSEGQLHQVVVESVSVPLAIVDLRRGRRALVVGDGLVDRRAGARTGRTVRCFGYW